MLASELSPYEIELGEVSSSGIFLQILFFKIKQSPPVLEANIVAQKMFKVDKEKYFPHLSLAYGDLSSEQITTLQQFVAQKEPTAEIHFLVDRIELWRTEGNVEEWQYVTSLPFGKP